MPDVIWQNEPIATEREITVDLFNPAGTARVTGGAAGAVIRVGKPGANLVVDGACTLTELTGGADYGPYRLRLSPSAVQALGEVSWEIANPGVIAIVHGTTTIRTLDGLYYGAVLAAAGSTIDLDGASPGGSASALDGYYASIAAGRRCQVLIVAGTGAGQFRFGIDYVGATKRLTLDSPFLAVDATSVVRISAASGSIASDVFSTVMDPTYSGGAQYPTNARTFQQQWNLMMSYMFGPGDGLDGTVGSLGPPTIGEPLASPPPHRAEFTVTAGKRRFTKLDGT